MFSNFKKKNKKEKPSKKKSSSIKTEIDDKVIKEIYDKIKRHGIFIILN
jgi:hypothetical protein